MRFGALLSSVISGGSDGERGEVMYPDTMLDLAKVHIQELHKEAARARLARSQSPKEAGPRASAIWIGLGKVRSKTA